MRIERVGSDLRITIEPDDVLFVLGLAMELAMAGFMIYISRDIVTDSHMLLTIRIGRIIMTVTLFPALLWITPGWTWMTTEVITLSSDELRIRRQLGSIGGTTVYNRTNIRNIRTRTVSVKGYRHTVEFDHYCGSELFGKDLDGDEAQLLIQTLKDWQTAGSRHIN